MPASRTQEVLEDVAARSAAEILAATERACEISLQQGVNGVMIERPLLEDGPITITASHPDVPYGAIFRRAN